MPNAEERSNKMKMETYPLELLKCSLDFSKVEPMKRWGWG